MIAPLIDRLIEASVVPSFTRIGPGIRRRLFHWKPLQSYDLSGRVVVLSGGTSGIGEAAAERYAQLGATLTIVARDAAKCEALLERLANACSEDVKRSRFSAVIADLGNLAEVRRASAEMLDRHSRIDVLAHNAGALFPTRRHADGGTDLAVELMVAAPFLMTGLLLPALRADNDGQPARVLTMSSGGMYTEPLTVEELDMPEASYSGTAQYARAKRAQVVLNELWATRVASDKAVFHALHPGWVDTPGITEALPGFSTLLSPLGLLRSAREGADTMVWLSADKRALASNGEFWLDREPRATHKLAKTRGAESDDRRQALWDWCEAHCGWSFDGS